MRAGGHHHEMPEYSAFATNGAIRSPTFPHSGRRVRSVLLPYVASPAKRHSPRSSQETVPHVAGNPNSLPAIEGIAASTSGQPRFVRSSRRGRTHCNRLPRFLARPKITIVPGSLLPHGVDPAGKRLSLRNDPADLARSRGDCPSMLLPVLFAISSTHFPFLLKLKRQFCRHFNPSDRVAMPTSREMLLSTVRSPLEHGIAFSFPEHAFLQQPLCARANVLITYRATLPDLPGLTVLRVTLVQESRRDIGQNVLWILRVHVRPPRISPGYQFPKSSLPESCQWVVDWRLQLWQHRSGRPHLS